MAFPNFAALAAYFDTTIIANGNEEIDGPDMNVALNGLLDFIEQSPLNWQTAQVISTGGTITGTRPIAVFITTTPASLQWADNIYNQYIFINATDGIINLGGGMVYYDINLVAKTTIPARAIVNIVKASNTLWISAYNSAATSGGSYTSISDTISIAGTTYTNVNLSGATQLKYVIVNRQLFTTIDSDFSFSGTTLTFSSITLSVGDTITIPFKGT